MIHGRAKQSAIGPSLLVFVIALLGVMGTVFFARLAQRSADERMVLEARLEQMAKAGPLRREAARRPSRRWAEPPIPGQEVGAPPSEGAAEADGKLASAAALQREVGTLSASLRRELIQATMALDHTRRWEALEQLGFGLSSYDFRCLVNRIGTDGRGLMELRIVLGKWGDVDPAAAAAWVSALPEGARSQQGAAALAVAWGRHDASRAAAWAETLPSGLARDSAMRHICTAMATTNAPAALEWSGRIEDTELRESVIPVVASQWVRQDADAAAAWIVALPAGAGKDSAVRHLAVHMAATEPPIAVEWCEHIEDDNIYVSAIAGVAREWADKDPAAASAWVLQFESGRLRDAVVLQFATELTRTDPDLAAKWAGSIEDDDVRRSALTTVAHQWLALDREAAGAWLLTAPLPEATRQSLLKRMGAAGSPVPKP